MIIIPMLGKSSRFFNEGYLVPKYQLPLGKSTVFSESVKSFKKYFRKEHFLFIVKNNFNSKIFVENEVRKLGVMNYKVIEFDQDTKGQAETVFIALEGVNLNEQIIIFNIDTIRYDFIWPRDSEFGDGFLEVFQAEGSNWSFIEAGKNFTVTRTTEKERISNLCSNGIYGFAKASYFINAYNQFITENDYDKEIYIAPLFNSMIQNGLLVKYRVVSEKNIEHCGIPFDYEILKKRIGNGERF